MVDKNGIDAILIRYAGVKTPAELAEMTGLDELEVAQRTQQALNKVDYLSLQQRRAKLILQLEDMAAQSLDRLTDTSDRNFSAIVNSAAGAIGRVVKELRDQEKDAEADKDAMMESYTRRFVELIGKAYERSVGALQLRYPEESPEGIKELLESNIQQLAREYDAE